MRVLVVVVVVVVVVGTEKQLVGVCVKFQCLVLSQSDHGHEPERRPALASPSVSSIELL